jgi:8-oxo-dGTP pyrophosphatase MutT (NUDIX family)
MVKLLNVFQPGLKRGSERLPHDPSKSYAYVEHPTEGWRVYLRSCAFLHELGTTDPKRFLVVKRTGSRYTSATWEPPKGQMEGKDMRRNPQESILGLLAENVRRETFEESHITDIQVLRHTGFVFQSQESDFPPNWFFQYHIFQGLITPSQIQQSFETFEWIKEHPKAFSRFSRDRKEKDAVAWYSPSKTKLNPRWCPSIAALYLNNIKSL